MHKFAYLKSQIFNTPLMVHPAKLDAIWGAVGPRVTGEQAAQRMAEEAEPDAQAEPQGAAEDMDRLPYSHKYQVTPAGVAVIPVTGILVNKGATMNAYSGMTGYANIEARLIHARDNEAVKAVLLAIDSPGGAVAGCFELAEVIKETKDIKPVWAVADPSAYSAAYALACAADKVYVARAGGVGSIGVIAWHIDQSIWDAKLGVEWTPIFAGARKKDFSPHEALGGEARKRLQEDINTLYADFTRAVATNRGLDLAAVVATEAGTFMGPKAIEAGLADEIGDAKKALADLTAEITDTGGIVRMAAAAIGNNQSMEGGELAKPKTKDTEAAATVQPEPEGNAQGEQVKQEQVSADAKAEERKRVGEIMGCDEAKGREGLAQYLALETDTDPATAKGMLAKAAKEQAEPAAQVPGGEFAQAMARESEGVEPGAAGAEGAENGPTMAEVMAKQLKARGLTPVGQ